MNDNYLIPANSKKSQLILGFFKLSDLILFGIGAGISLALLIFIQNANFGIMILILMPAIITGFLVLPVPNYHNVLQFIINVYTFYSEPRMYVWKGWCHNGQE